MKKKFFGLLLTAAMCLSLLPSTALAEETVAQMQELTEQEQPVAEEEPAKEISVEEMEQEEPVATQEIAEQGIAVQATSATVGWYDGVDSEGNITQVSATRNGEYLENSSTDVTLAGAKYYMVKENTTVTINGNLTIDGSASGGLILCQGATLTINGALIHNGGTGFCIYGQSNNGANVGKLIINNSNGNGAAIRSTANNAQLCINSGEVTINGGTSKELVDNVQLYSENHIHEGILDDNTVLPSEWGKSSVSGGKLVLAYCDHPDADAVWIQDDDTQHHWQCKTCGFTSTAKEEHDFRPVEWTEQTHTMKCDHCGYAPAPANHNFITSSKPVVASDGKGHSTEVCTDCGYTSGESQPHNYDKTGTCTDCEFTPVARDKNDNLYGTIEEAIERGVTELWLVSYATDDNYKNILWEEVEIGEGVALTLHMNDVKLRNTGNAPLTVSGGTLKVTGTAIIENTGKSQDTVGSAIEVKGGELIFEDTLNVTGSAKNSSAAPAILVTDGTVTFQKDVTATAVENAGSSTLTNPAIAPAIKVTGGKLIFNGKLTAVGGLGGVSGNTRPCEPAVYAEGGELEFNGDLDLNGGLTITGDAKLTKGLTQGTFKVDYSGQTVTGSSVSVVGSANYKNINSLLAANHAFFDTEREGYLGASYKYWTGNVTIKEHTHTWAKTESGDNYECTVCGQACAHEGGYKDGACAVCGQPCPHAIADQSPKDYNYYCNDCGQQMFARIQTDTYKWSHFKDLKTALEAAENGQTITLLDDFDQGSQTACLTGDNKTVTLNLNGHTITGGWIHVGWGENWADPVTSSTLEIIGSGSFNGVLSVREKATLDLSDWGGGTSDMIHEVGLSKNGDTQPNLEGLLTVGENAGTINTLAFYNWPSAGIRSTLKGGTYGKIWITTQLDEGEPYSGMLAPGYAFQYTDKDGFVEYTKRAEYTSVNTIENIKVVPCPHKKVENGTCAYCGTTGIKAVLDGRTVYSDIDTALNAWMTSGRELTLYDTASISDTTWSGSGERVLNLNGYALTGGEVDLASGLDLTIRDTSANGTGKIDSLKVNNGAKLTLESGEIGSLDVESAADGDVKLRGGKVTSSVSDSKVLVYRLLEDGYYLEKSALLEKFSGGPYEVKKANITVGGEKTGKIAIGKNIVNIPVSLTLADTSTTAVEFDWYLVGTNKNEPSKLASQTAAVTGGVAKYDPTTVEKSLEAGWDSLVQDTDYTLVCMATGMAADGNVSWQAALNGYTLKMLPPSIEDAKITFAPGWQEKIFWPDPADNSVGKIEMPSIDAYAVTLNGTKLTEGTDYKIISGNIATGIGTQNLTIEGIAPNYSGTKTAQWTVVPHTLKMLQISQISKQYDGTDALPDGALVDYFNSEVSGYNQQIKLKEGTDYVVTDARFDTPDASDDAKGYRYTVELKNPNYVFADGKKVQTAVYGENVTTTVRITKADAPEATEHGTLTVTNNTAAEYTFDFASLLPALENLKEYGILHYSNDTSDGASYGFDKGYFNGNMTLDAATGKLTLPIQAVNSTEEGKIGSVTVIVSSTNFENIPLTLDVYAENRKSTGGGGGSKKHNTLSTPKEEKPSEDTTTEDNTTKENFADVPADAWFKDAVEYVSDNGLMSGVEKDNFAPKVLTNRAMLVTILWRLESCPTGGQTTEFSDIKAGDYFHNAVLWAAENKIVSGISETNFAPNDSITREQLAAILYRYAVYKGYDVTQGGMAVREFSDYESISDYARGSVAWAVNTGILSGKGENILDPKGVATRAEVASMLMRFCENIAK